VGGQEIAVPRRVAAAIALGTLLNPLNSSMIAVALVSLQHAFGVGLATSSWLVSGFYLAACVGQPLMGRIADRFGPRRVYCAGLVVVLVAGVAALVAPGFGWLVGCRVAQALGTSAAFPAGLATIRRMAGGKPPAATLAAISVTNATSAALGPVLGGFLVAGAGWRGIFAVNIPLAAVGLVLALWWLPADPSTPASSGLLAELDLPGVALFSATVVGLLAFLLSLGSGPQWWLLAVFPLSGGLLTLRELSTPSPFLDLRTLAGHLPLVRALAQQVGVQLVFYSIFYGLPLWLERVRHLSPHAAGLLMLPVAAIGVALTPVAAVRVRQAGPRPALLVGCAGLVVGSLAVLTIGDSTPILGIVAVGTVLGLPNGFNNIALQAAVYAGAPEGHTGVAAGLFQTCRYLGAIMSTALLGVAYSDDLSSAGLHRVAVFVTGVAVLLTFTAYRMRDSDAQHRAAWTLPRFPDPDAGPGRHRA
jgi:MFS family permease